MTKNTSLTFLKLGGSLITDKTRQLTAKEDVIARLAAEIAVSQADRPNRTLVIGHGSGSFGHAIAHQYQTQDGVSGRTGWQGFAEVWMAARELNQIVVSTLGAAGLPVIAFPPSAGVLAAGKQLQSWDTQPLQAALSHRLVPVVQGDVIFDTQQGGTIFSTEQVFQHLARPLQPSQILLAGAEAGVYLDPSRPEAIIPAITPNSFEAIKHKLSGSGAVDVTGGMLSKVEWMLSLVRAIPNLQVRIFSGAVPGQVQKALAGEPIGTLISL